MGNELAVRLAIALLGAAFGSAAAIFRAGAARAKQDQKLEKNILDLNTLGKKYRRLLAVLTRWADTPEKIAQIADLIEDK